jgi:predicted metal-binding membrane protein
MRLMSGGAATTSMAGAEHSSGHAFLGASALLFAVSATATIIWCTWMSAMGGMAMPGGWTMSMAGYFFVWTVFGIAAFPLGVAVAAIEMRQPAVARAVPIAIGAVTVVAGALQFTAWKARHLACCREAPALGGALRPDTAAAWRYGLRLGLHCAQCCAGLIAILLVLGVMDIRVMTVVTTAITAERLAPAGERVARATGAIIVGSGIFLIARAAFFGPP